MKAVCFSAPGGPEVLRLEEVPDLEPGPRQLVMQVEAAGVEVRYGENTLSADKVVLDQRYEARDIDQRLGSQDKIDAWFEAKTKGLNDWQKDELMKHWGTMQRVLSSKERIDRVVADIVFDFSVKPRLSAMVLSISRLSSSVIIHLDRRWFCWAFGGFISNRDELNMSIG